MDMAMTMAITPNMNAMMQTLAMKILTPTATEISMIGSRRKMITMLLKKLKIAIRRNNLRIAMMTKIKNATKSLSNAMIGKIKNAMKRKNLHIAMMMKIKNATKTKNLSIAMIKNVMNTMMMKIVTTTDTENGRTAPKTVITTFIKRLRILFGEDKIHLINIQVKF